MAKILLDHGADVNAKTNLGYTPLHHASSLGKFGYYSLKIGFKLNDWFLYFVGKDVAKILIQNGAKINAKANDGMTALHRAAWQSMFS